MDTTTTKKTKQATKAQKGFSLIELSMVISIMGLLLVGTNLAFNSARKNINEQQATEALEFHFPAAVLQCQNRRNGIDLTACTAGAIQTASALTDTRTPWGSNWSVVVVASAGVAPYLEVTYPLTGAPDAEALADSLVIKLDAIENITAAEATTGTNPTQTLVVTYTP